MNLFRALWQVHKWLGIALGLLLVLTASTGLLLLVKKDYDWIQPPTQRGVGGTAEQYRPLHEVYGAVFAMGVPELQQESDIARIDFRPGKGIHKVRSKRGDVEVQVDAVTLKTFGPEVRRSDWIERLHDGSLVGDWMHGYVMPTAAVALVALSMTGYLIWLMPIAKKRRKRKERARSETGAAGNPATPTADRAAS